MSTNVRPNGLTRSASVMGQEAERALSGFDLIKGLKTHFSLIFGILALMAVYLCKGQLLALVDHPISEITVTGQLHQLKAADVSAKVSPWLDASFLTADLEKIKAEVEQLPWVYHATVSRIWPGKLQINTVEQVPVAQWNGASYLNSEGDIFTPAQLTWERELPALIGPLSTEVALRTDMLMKLEQLKGLLGNHGVSLKALELKPRGAWKVRLSEGVGVELGQPPFEEKIDRMAAVWSGAVAETRNRMETIDTRYPNGVAIKWKEAGNAPK